MNLSFEEWVKLVAAALQAAAIVVTAVFAVRSLRAWRSQLVGKRKFEIAEDAVVTFSKACDALASIRNPMARSTEMASRPKGEGGESEDVAKMRDTYYVPLHRIQETSEVFGQLERLSLLCGIHFGPNAAKPFETLFRARHRVAVSARMLITTARDSIDRTPYKRREKWEDDIWGIGDESDKLALEVVNAKQALESICLPHLR